MIVRAFIVTAMLVTMIKLSFAQQVIPDRSLEEYIEYLVSIGFDDIEAVDLTEDISSLLNKPVDINFGSESELNRLFFLTSFQVKSIIKYVSQKGPIISKYEIAYIPGFDEELARLLSSYIIVSARNVNSSKRGSSAGLISDIILSDRDTITYPGSRLKSSTRLSLNSGSTSIGLTMEKDRGEKLFHQGFQPEFLSGNLHFSPSESSTQIIIGDYRARYGQGLVMWHGYSPGISPINPNLIRGASRIVPYSSTDENNFFRGIAAAGNIGTISYSIYISSNNIDGNRDISPDSTMVVRSLYDNGIHNSETTLLKRDVLREYSAGFNLNHNFNRINLGLTFSGTLFSEPIVPESLTETYFDFEGDRNLAISIDHAASLKNIYLYGELAMTGKGRLAILQGLRVYPGERVKLNILYAYISKGYNSFHGHVFGKETVNNFKSSILANIQLDVAPHLILSSGVIYHSDLWYAYRSGSFPRSVRYRSELIWTPSEIIKLKCSLGQKENSNDIPTERGIEKSEKAVLKSLRMNLEIYPLERLKLTSRFERALNPQNKEKGCLAYQGARLDLSRIPLSLIIRFYAYSTDTYATRIYAWEDDLLYHPSVPALYGRGSRTYFLADFHPGRKFSIRLKYGITEFMQDRQEIKFNEFRVQAKIRI